MKIEPGWKWTTATFVLLMSLAPATGFANDADAPGALVTSALDVIYVGQLGKTDSSGRLLVWEGNIKGDLTGKIEWWFVEPPPETATKYMGGKVDYYRAKWKIWIDGKLVLVGESAGKTVTPKGSDGMWDGHGVVTEAHGKFARLKGKQVYETGPVIYGSNPPVSLTSTGMFEIY